MGFGESILGFFDGLEPPAGLPPEVGVLWPYDSPEVKRVMGAFYRRYFPDDGKRIFLVGINPGRFGAGVTGLCFTDPVRLAADCGIPHGLAGGGELSSDFTYRMIAAMGGPGAFYGRFYLTALSPVGFVKDGRNLNYYDPPVPADALDGWMADAMAAQVAAGADRRTAFSMGMGENFRRFSAFNERHGFFDRVEPLPHPRWVMQYRRRRLEEFIGVYRDRLSREAEGRTPTAGGRLSGRTPRSRRRTPG